MSRNTATRSTAVRQSEHLNHPLWFHHPASLRITCQHRHLCDDGIDSLPRAVHGQMMALFCQSRREKTQFTLPILSHVPCPFTRRLQGCHSPCSPVIFLLLPNFTKSLIIVKMCIGRVVTEIRDGCFQTQTIRSLSHSPKSFEGTSHPLRTRGRANSNYDRFPANPELKIILLLISWRAIII
jgi:hypothetical protein